MSCWNKLLHCAMCMKIVRAHRWCSSTFYRWGQGHAELSCCTLDYKQHWWSDEIETEDETIFAPMLGSLTVKTEFVGFSLVCWFFPANSSQFGVFFVRIANKISLGISQYPFLCVRLKTYTGFIRFYLFCALNTAGFAAYSHNFFPIASRRVVTTVNFLYNI
jgi:hypothetical protein